jgi:hypothetical protein
MVVMVAYDLKKPGQNYTGLIEELKKKPWWHALESTWLLDTSETPAQVWARIKKYIDTNDSVLVIEMKKGTAAGADGRLPKEAWEWILARLKRSGREQSPEPERTQLAPASLFSSPVCHVP